MAPAVRAPQGKIHRVDALTHFGSTLTASNRGSQSNRWVDRRITGQPCGFRVRRTCWTRLAPCWAMLLRCVAVTLTCGYTRARCHSSPLFVPLIGIPHTKQNAGGRMTEGPRRSPSRGELTGPIGLSTCRRQLYRVGPNCEVWPKTLTENPY